MSRHTSFRTSVLCSERDPDAGSIAEAFHRHAGAPPELVFECVGTPGMIQEAISLSRLFGRVVVAGACMEQDRLSPMLALQREITMSFALGHTRDDFAFVLDCLQRGVIRPAKLITGIVGFADFPAAFEALRSAKNACTLLLRPS